MPRMPLEGTASAPARRRLLTLALCAGLCLAFVAASARDASAQPATGSRDLVISQVYTRGGEPGATFRNDYIEMFNRGTTSVNLFDYRMQISTTGEGASPDVSVRFVGSGGIILDPGQYIMFALGSSGTGGDPLPAPPEFNGPGINLGSASGKIALFRNTSFTPLGCPLGQDAGITDYVAYGAASCAEGGAPAPAPATVVAALLRKGNGCTDTDNNAGDFDAAAPNPRNRDSAGNVCGASPTANSVQFESAQVNTVEGAGSVEIFVTRSGDTTTPATVQYATIDGEPASPSSGGAIQRSDFTTAIGTLRFAAGETRKSFPLLVTDDAYDEAPQSLTIRLGSPVGVGLGAQVSTTVTIADNDTTPEGPNPIDSTSFFVRQHYHDFLNREPDAPGFAFWSEQIDECETRPEAERQGCREVRRINVSAAFFLAIEFQETGYLVYRAYKASYPDSAQRPRGFPTYREFEHDAQDTARGVIIGQPGAEQLLEQNRQLFFNEFVARPEFTLSYPATLTAAQFVDALNANTGGALSTTERDALVAGLESGAETRATALRRVADDEDFRVAEFNRAFVLTQYFGYLRRSPNEVPDNNFVGYDFWLTKLNNHNGNFITAEMVKGFITSGEYRARFGAQ